jgi:hypothetical protein
MTSEKALLMDSDDLTAELQGFEPAEHGNQRAQAQAISNKQKQLKRPVRW